jgi:hypothetical protein
MVKQLVTPSRAIHSKAVRKKAPIAVAILLAAVISGFWWARVHQRPLEPIYEGKPLREWLKGFDANQGSVEYLAAQAAVRHMGTNALPTLISCLSYKDPPFFRQWILLNAKMHLLQSGVDYEWTWHRRAGIACGELGQIAEPAFPAMVRAANDPLAADEVVHGFMNLFPNSAASLTNLLVSGSNPVTRARAADGLIMGWFYPDLVPTVQTVLTNALRDLNNGVRMAAASTLGHARDHREMIVPALSKALSDPDPSVRGNAATSLGAFGTEAKDAVPELLKLLEDTNSYPRQRSAEMLLKIDPEAAAKAGIGGQGSR